MSSEFIDINMNQGGTVNIYRFADGSAEIRTEGGKHTVTLTKAEAAFVARALSKAAKPLKVPPPVDPRERWPDRGAWLPPPCETP